MPEHVFNACHNAMITQSAQLMVEVYEPANISHFQHVRDEGFHTTNIIFIIAVNSTVLEFYSAHTTHTVHLCM